MILLVDNYDSFVHNLARYVERLGQETLVLRNDVASPEQVRRHRPAALVLSPGPCSPSEAGYSLELVQQLQGEVPILGICLGHQAIAAALGAQIVRAPVPWHGRTSQVRHRGSAIFRDVPSPFTAGRYHSLAVDPATLPPLLEVTAETLDGVIMAIEHRARAVVGLQFHPESILTAHGYQLLANFLRVAELPVSLPLPTMADEYRAPAKSEFVPPDEPVTF